MTKQTESYQAPDAGLTFRAVVLGLVLIPVNTYFIIVNEVKYIGTLATTVSLIYNVVITLTVLIALNHPMKRLVPRFALKRGELLAVFMMLSLSSAIAGHDIMQTMVPTIPTKPWSVPQM